MSESKTTAVTKKQTEITQAVLHKVEQYQQTGELQIPSDYSPNNALKAAYLVLSEAKTSTGKPILEACTQASIANALLKMVVWGLSPMKKQVDFIPYGNQLQASPSYTGNIAMARRYAGLKDIKANVIMKGDEFEFEVDAMTGHTKITKHKQSLQSLDGEMVGVYAVYEMENGSRDVEIMTLNDIHAAWSQGAAKGQSPAHKKFPQRMACKTVINRVCRMLINSSDDSVLFDAPETDPTPYERTKADLDHTIETEAAVETLDIESEEVPAEEQAETKPMF